MGGTKHAIEFLADEALASRIRSLVKGRGVCCAVAFWTEGGVDRLFPERLPHGMRILVDIGMGNTSPSALKKLGAPGNPHLRHSDRMHAKVFLSDRGLIVGSANATGGALDGQNTETGTFHLAGSPAWQQASDWFGECFRDADRVGREELALAELLYRARPTSKMPRLPRDGSLLDIVREAPGRFAKVGFVFSGARTTPEQRKAVRKAVRGSGNYDFKVIDGLEDGGIFHDWDRDDVRRWPEYFFFFWQPAEKLRLFGYRWVAKDLKSGSLMAERDLPGVKSLCEWKVPPAEQIGRADRELARSIRNENNGQFFANGEKLAEKLAELGSRVQ